MWLLDLPQTHNDCEKLLCFRYYDGTTLDYIAQSDPLIIKHPVNRLKKFIKVRRQQQNYNGIENGAFQDSETESICKNSLSSEEFDVEKEEACSDTKMKMPLSIGLECPGSMKKKMRGKGSGKSPNKEYYQIWNASTSPSPEAEENICGLSFPTEASAPPLPPRTLHRPLERSHAVATTTTTFIPPAVHRQNKPRKMQNPEDTFNFELIDTDEEYKSFSNASTTSSLSDVDCGTSTPTHKMKAGYSEANGKKLIGCDNYITTVLSKRSADSSRQDAHLVVEKKDSQSSQSSSSADVVDGCSSTSDLSAKTHKPLTRQIPDIEGTSDESQHTPLHRPKTEVKELLRPHPKALQRVAAVSSNLVNLPVCPPTPTHHSRKARAPDLRPPDLKAAEPPDFGPHEVLPPPDVKRADVRPLETLDAWGGPSTQSSASERDNITRIGLIAMSELRNLEQDLVRARIESNGESSSCVPLPLQRLSTTRLPSIPERSHRVLGITDIPGEHEEPLPPSWEARMDSHGRVFYIDHATRTTSWSRPGGDSAENAASGAAGAEQHRRQLDRRYQSIRRTISSMRLEEGVTIDLSRIPPGCQLLTRPDFFTILHMNQEALELYNGNSTLKHMIVRIRRDPNMFEKYQHNKELVALVNLFADPSKDLSNGWDTKKDRNGKQFFIDHTNKKTTYMDPRVPTEPSFVRRMSDDNAPVPPPRPTTSTSSTLPEVPVAYNDKVVAFLRQPNIFDILRERHPPVGNSSSLRDKVNAVRVDGTSALDRLSHDVHLTILLR